MKSAPSNSPALEGSARSDWTTGTVISIAHGTSHFFQLLLVTLFPWIKEAFGLSYTQLGFLMTVFYVVSGLCQSASGFLVDKLGARKVLALSLGLLAVVGLGTAASNSYGMLIIWAAIAGVANCPFHPVDYSIMNARVSKERLPMVYSIHAVCGNLGWAFAPVFLLSINSFFGWRVAAASAGVFAIAVLALCLVYWQALDDSNIRIQPTAKNASGSNNEAVNFLKLPVLWWSFLYFALLAAALSGFQTFAGEASKSLHGLPAVYAAGFVTVYAVAGAIGMVLGGMFTKTDGKLEQTIMVTFTTAAVVSILMAFVSVPALVFMGMLAFIGFISGFAQTSRDLLIRRVTPPGATGRVYGFVYSGLDAGIALAPLAFGWMMDKKLPIGIWIAIAVLQVLMVANVWKIARLSHAK